MERIARETGGADFDGQGKGLVEGSLVKYIQASYATATSELVEDPAQGWAGIGLVKR